MSTSKTRSDDPAFTATPLGFARGSARKRITKRHWEGVGVIPHIAVPATDALDAACRDAEKKINARRHPRDD